MAAVKIVSYRYEPPNRTRADAAFQALLHDGTPAGDMLHFTSLVYHRCFAFALKHDRTVAVHSGVWGDFRQSHPCHLIPLAQAYPGNRFDLFHLGMPFVREAVMIGKMFPNVSLNICWNTIVSPEQTVRMLDECVDLVPLNNLIAFGADYRTAVEKVYGHLVMAKEVVARVLAKRIDREQMDLDDAVHISKLWFHDNAVRLYGLA
jgi:predicted TIM-barrel fold metal-dependent hydrolase